MVQDVGGFGHLDHEGRFSLGEHVRGADPREDAIGELGIYTNTTPVDAYRGAGRPEAIYLLERVMDRAARELGVSPSELRRRLARLRGRPDLAQVAQALDVGLPTLRDILEALLKPGRDPRSAFEPFAFSTLAAGSGERFVLFAATVSDPRALPRLSELFWRLDFLGKGGEAIGTAEVRVGPWPKQERDAAGALGARLAGPTAA